MKGINYINYTCISHILFSITQKFKKKKPKMKKKLKQKNKGKEVFRAKNTNIAIKAEARQYI